MPNDKQSVNDSESLSDNESESLSVEGKQSSTSDNQTLEQIRAENKRKAGEIQALREQVNGFLQEKENRLQELEEKERLSSSEKAEMRTLEDEVNDIRRDKRSKPWLKLTEDVSDTVAKNALHQYDMELTSHRLASMAKQENLEVAQFEQEIVGYMQRTDPLAQMPGLVRLEKAHELYQEEKKKMKSQPESKERPFSDMGGSRPATKTPNRGEILDNIVGKNRNSRSMSDALRGIHEAQEEARNQRG